jgi:phage terminase large subunit
MASVTLPNQWAARPYQFPLFNAILKEGKKRAACVWHRRAGKDSCAINLLAVLSQMRVGTWWHCLPSFQQGRRVVWEGIDKQGRRIIEQAFPSELVESKNETNMQIKLKNGSVYQVVGSDSFDSLVGTNPIGVIFSEYSLADPRSWDYVRPILAENDGLAIFIYTPRGKNHGWSLYNMASANPEWFCERLTVEDTQAIPMAIVEEERKAGMEEALLKQEFYVDFTAAIVGSYYADLIHKMYENGAICDFEFDTHGINTHWDLGISDSTAIWFWRVGADGEPEIIDAYQAHGLPISHYVKVLEAKGYHYVRHWLPHDAQARTLATGMSVMEQMRDQGLPIAISPRLSIQDGIQASRSVLMSPIKVHKTNCKQGLDALEAYHREYDEVTKMFKDKPAHDWSSHYADSFRYMALSIKAATRMTRTFEQKRMDDLKDKSAPKILLPTLDEMWSIRERELGKGFRGARI